MWVDRARAILREALRQADLFLPSMDDMQHLTGNDDPERTLDWIRDAGATGVWCSSWARTAPSSTTATGASRWRRTEAVDATGAGDCFAGSLLARRCKGDSWEDAVRYANVAAALSTLGYGAVEPCPARSRSRRNCRDPPWIWALLGPVGVFFGFQAKMPSYPNFPPACR